MISANRMGPIVDAVFFINAVSCIVIDDTVLTVLVLYDSLLGSGRPYQSERVRLRSDIAERLAIHDKLGLLRMGEVGH